MFKKIASFLLVSTILSAPALADKSSEAYVERNANSVLLNMNKADLSDEELSAQFNTVMNTFTDMDRVARFAVGRYGRQFSEAEFEAYSTAFIAYALAYYETQFDKFRGEEIEVLGSVDLRPGDSVVKTRILAPKSGKKFNVEWRVRQDKDSNDYKVLDVALNIEGSQIWLAQEQQAQFVSMLDHSNGSASNLISRIEEMTVKLKMEKELATNSNSAALEQN